MGNEVSRVGETCKSSHRTVLGEEQCRAGLTCQPGLERCLNEPRLAGQECMESGPIGQCAGRLTCRRRSDGDCSDGFSCTCEDPITGVGRDCSGVGSCGDRKLQSCHPYRDPFGTKAGPACLSVPRKAGQPCEGNSTFFFPGQAAEDLACGPGLICQFERTETNPGVMGVARFAPGVFVCQQENAPTPKPTHNFHRLEASAEREYVAPHVVAAIAAVIAALGALMVLVFKRSKTTGYVEEEEEEVPLAK